MCNVTRWVSGLRCMLGVVYGFAWFRCVWWFGLLAVWVLGCDYDCFVVVYCRFPGFGCSLRVLVRCGFLVLDWFLAWFCGFWVSGWVLGI